LKITHPNLQSHEKALLFKKTSPASSLSKAIFEAKTATVELLRHCRFEMVPGQEITYGDKITMDIKSNGKEQFLVYVKPW
jgi:hypothetical protein